jgi:dTDP-4-amino-4,6-dideoxygalactose transaminase
MTIPLVDLKAQYLSIKDEIDAAIQRVVDSTNFILGPDVRAFEEEFARFCGVQHAVGVDSGTAALHLAFLACDIGPGDEVITTPHTFIATIGMLGRVGAKPVFVDIDPRTYNMNPDRIEAAITERAKAIMPVHLYGQPAEMDPILEIADRHGLKVIEDAAQAHGAEYKGRRAGSMGHVAIFSFYPGKNLGAYGDAGALVTNDGEIAEKVRLLRNHGRREKYEHLLQGFNYRIDTLQAAILRAKLAHLEEWNEARRRHVATYRELLSDLDLVLPYEPEHVMAVYHLFVVRLEGSSSRERDDLREHLKARGISTGIHYPIPLHLQPAYRHLGYKGGDFPFTEECARQVLSLPMYPELTQAQMEGVARAIKEFWEG